MRLPRLLFAVGLALFMGLPLADVSAQAEKSGTLMVPVGDTTALSMSAKQFITRVVIVKPGIVNANARIDGASVIISGIAPGTTPLELTDEKGNKETFEVLVRRQVLVPLGVPLSWQCPDKTTIQKVVLDNEKIARVKPAPTKPGTVDVEPLAEGGAQFTLTDADGKSEAVLLHVKKPDRLIEVGAVEQLGLSTKKAIQRLQNNSKDLVRVTFPEPKDVQVLPIGDLKEVHIAKGDSISVSITGLSVGLTRIIIGDKDDKFEVVWIGVKPKK